jgi:IS30 family transposase
MHFRRQRDILLTLQERKSRLTLARRLSGKDADTAGEWLRWGVVTEALSWR